MDSHACSKTNRLNLWRELAIKPCRGSWRLLLRHIYRVLGGGDRKAGRYIVKWLAWMFQNLNAPAEVVLVFQASFEIRVGEVH